MPRRPKAMNKEEEFVPVPEPKKKTRKPRKAKAAPKKKASKGNGAELRLSQLEQVELNLCDRDYELSIKDIELVNARIRNLTMDYHKKSADLKDQLRNAQVKSENLALVRNKKLAEIEARLRSIKEDFSFKDYLEQDDGLLIKAEDKVAALEPTNTVDERPDEVTS